jgi:hypothetical protein
MKLLNCAKRVRFRNYHISLYSRAEIHQQAVEDGFSQPAFLTVTSPEGRESKKGSQGVDHG